MGSRASGRWQRRAERWHDVIIFVALNLTLMALAALLWVVLAT